MNRRGVILSGLAVVGAGAGGWFLGHWAVEAEIASVLRRRLSYLTLDPHGVGAFAKDQSAAAFAKKIPTWNRLRYHWMASESASFRRFFRSTDDRSRVARLEDALISTYLLSSDFFINGADEARTVGYVAYYDPVRPCQNPFARPVTSAS